MRQAGIILALGFLVAAGVLLTVQAMAPGKSDHGEAELRRLFQDTEEMTSRRQPPTTREVEAMGERWADFERRHYGDSRIVEIHRRFPVTQPSEVGGDLEWYQQLVRDGQAVPLPTTRP
jgi:hypothetical protein